MGLRESRTRLSDQTFQGLPGRWGSNRRKHSSGFSLLGRRLSLQCLVSEPLAASLPLSLSCQGVGSRLDGLRNRGPGCTWDSLRNSVGEKILSLRSCSLGSLGALGPACCSVLTELSEEQAFHVSYLDIGMASRGAGGRWGLDQSKYGWE